MRTNFFQFLFESDDPSLNEEWWCISAFKRTPEVGRRVRYRNRFVMWHWYFLSATLFVAMFAGFRAFGWRDSGGLRAFELPPVVSANAAWIAAAGLSFVAARCLFYSFIELWLSWGVGRYVAPNAFVALISLVFAMFAAGALTGGFVDRRRSRREQSPLSPDDS